MLVMLLHYYFYAIYHLFLILVFTYALVTTILINDSVILISINLAISQ